MYLGCKYSGTPCIYPIIHVYLHIFMNIDPFIHITSSTSTGESFYLKYLCKINELKPTPLLWKKKLWKIIEPSSRTLHRSWLRRTSTLKMLCVCTVHHLNYIINIFTSLIFYIINIVTSFIDAHHSWMHTINVRTSSFTCCIDMSSIKVYPPCLHNVWIYCYESGSLLHSTYRTYSSVISISKCG